MGDGSGGVISPNAWGLYDMHGNAAEWVEDCWHDNYEGAPMDGSAWLQGQCSYRVVRGGSWVNDPGYLRSANRGGDAPALEIGGWGSGLPGA